MTEQETNLAALQEKFKFKIESDPSVKGLSFLVFEDGRIYRFQKPSFMMKLDELAGAPKYLLALFKLGLKVTHPALDRAPNTPALNDEYMNSHEDEAEDLWLMFFREAL